MHLAERSGVVAVELQYLRNRCRAVGPDGRVAGKSRGKLRDAAHIDRMVVAPGQHGRAGRRAQRSGVEAGIGEPILRQPFRHRHVAGAAIRAGCPETHIVDQDDDDVGSARWRAQWKDSRRTCIARIERRWGFRLRLWDGQDRAAINRRLRPSSSINAESCQKSRLRSR